LDSGGLGTHTMAWDWLLRAAECCSFVWTPEILSRYRVHKGHKTESGGIARQREIRELVSRYASPEVEAHYDFLATRSLAR
jgi:hypothetical protein